MDIPVWLDQHQDEFTRLSDQVWDYAELGFKEERSASVLSQTLERAGFSLEYGVAGIPTAFVATFSNAAKPVIGILGEYDALPGLSQEAVPHRQPRVDGGSGHGCGHNLLGVAGLAACMAVRQAMLDGKILGTIRYYGCPAEEGGAAKAFMAKAGLFNDVDIALTWHPDAFNGVMAGNFLANYRVLFKFHGKAAHAAADPFNGRSALDAVELMNVGVNYLREHMIPDARVHYVIINGGSAPNIVPAEAASHYSVRAPRTDQLNDLFERVKDIARGAALMTGTELEIQVLTGMSNMLLNDSINALLQQKLEQVGPPVFTPEEKEFARQVSTTIPAGSLDNIGVYYGLRHEDVLRLQKSVLHEEILPLLKNEIVEPGSTDVGDVSWATPTGQIMTACMALGTPGHSWQTTAQGGMGIGHRGMLYAAKVLALSTMDYLTHPELLEAAREEFNRKRAVSNYISPIPDGLEPPL